MLDSYFAHDGYKNLYFISFYAKFLFEMM